MRKTNTYICASDLDTYATILIFTGRKEAARTAFNEVFALFASLGEDEGAAIEARISRAAHVPHRLV